MNFRRLILLTAAFFCSVLFLSAQPHALLQDFSGYQEGDHVQLRWTFRSGSLCEGTRIERSADGIFFSLIGEIPGFCGNPDSPITYFFRDTLPVTNQVNHYRLELGNYGYTTPVRVEHFTAGTTGFVVVNDGSGHTSIHFRKISGKKANAVIYNSSGKRVFAEEVEGSTLRLAPGRFATGIYILMLSFADNTAVSGTIFIP